ncbi:hypothetical protein COU59_03510, partial [Candidatus Pacearchaeota archaeon CG10_big_fil_rev_8_21_14_0_10_34_12]
SMAPKGTVHFNSGETKTINLMVYPQENFNYRGFYSFKYFIRGQDNTETSGEVTIKVIDLEDAFEIGSAEINPETNSMSVYIYNRENFDFEKISAKFSSPFFTKEESFSLGANEKKEFEISLNKEDFKKLLAGFYTLHADISVEGGKTEVDGTIKFTEKDILKTSEQNYGLIINTQIISKKNEGNIIVPSETVIKKNILSRLFTSLNPEPDSITRQGLIVYYTWSKQINPGEELNISVKTNWIIPLIAVIFILVAVILAKRYSKTDLVLNKRVSFVRAKGGEFALKITLFASAKEYVEKVNIVDRLPSLVKVYERFGSEKPKRINEKAKKIEWEFEKLEKGETRIMSYVIYSKIGILGKFALPTATAIYEKDGKIHEAESNRAFFIAEQGRGDSEE